MKSGTGPREASLGVNHFVTPARRQGSLIPPAGVLYSRSSLFDRDSDGRAMSTAEKPAVEKESKISRHAEAPAQFVQSRVGVVLFRPPEPRRKPGRRCLRAATANLGGWQKTIAKG